MQCNLSSIGRSICAAVASNGPRKFIVQSPRWLPTLSSRRISPTASFASSALATTKHPNPAIQGPVSPTELHAPSTTQRLLTEAQMSRAAAQAVRLSVQQHALGDAYYVVNSLRFTNIRTDESASTKIPGLRQSIQDFETVALQFGRPVSPRLASHTLLHGLVRLGFSHKAYKLAQLMMESGTRIRSTTLQTLMDALIHSTPPLGPRDVESPLPGSPKNPTADIRPSAVQHKGTQFALKLLLLARRSRSHRTDSMFELLICACIINGEIIVASILFGLLMKDWQPKRGATTPADNLIQTSAPPNTKAERTDRIRFVEKRNRPNNRVLLKLLRAIDKTSAHGIDKTYQYSRQSNLQALANLASLLDRRQLPFLDVAFLIRMLYNHPRGDEGVTILDAQSQPMTTKAFSYFHDVIGRLIDNLPTHPPFTREDKLLPFNVNTYNCLLHYALRHRLSLPMASQILEHMTTKRYIPLSPDIATCNVLLGAGTGLQRPDLVEKAIARITGAADLQDLVTVPAPMGSQTAEGDSLILQETNSRLSVIPKGASPLQADSYTLNAYITYLTATGRAHLLAGLLSQMFPNLASPLPFSGTDEEVKAQIRHAHRMNIRRGAELGPYFFTTILTTLRKLGKTKLAERVWFLAKNAEKESQRKHSGLEPWHLPVHAYTTMMQTCSVEARARFRIRTKGRRRFASWGKFIMPASFGQRLAPSNQERRLVVKLYRRFKTKSRNRWRQLSRTRSGVLPHVLRPDARFFNAALRPLTPRHAGRMSPSFLRQQFMVARRTYAENGDLPRLWSPVLQEVARDMITSGHDIPVGFKSAFIGRWPDIAIASTNHENGPPPCQPYAYPRRKQPPLPHSLPTYKSRGLPRRRRPKRRPKL